MAFSDRDGTMDGSRLARRVILVTGTPRSGTAAVDRYPGWAEVAARFGLARSLGWRRAHPQPVRARCERMARRGAS